MDVSLSYSKPRAVAADSGAESTELVIDIICIMSQLTNPDRTLFFSVHRVL